MTCPLRQNCGERGHSAPLAEPAKSLLTIWLCRYLQLGLQLLMMRDGNKRRRIPSVHWAGEYSNLITSVCLENGITFSLQTCLSLRASKWPRSGRLHCLSLCRCVYIGVLRKALSYKWLIGICLPLSALIAKRGFLSSSCITISAHQDVFWFNQPPTLRCWSSCLSITWLRGGQEERNWPYCANQKR